MNLLFELRSALKLVFLPPSVFLLCMFIGLLFYRRHSNARLLVWCSFFALTVTSTGVIAMYANRVLESQYPALSPEAVSVAVEKNAVQAIVLLGGGVRLGALEEPNQTSLSRLGLERASYAARLARQTRLPILASGGILAPATVTEARVLTRTLDEHFGVSVRWLEDRSINTSENALFSAKILKAHGIERVFLVTSASHMPRSVREFERNGIKVIAAGSGYWTNAPIIWRSFVPSIYGAERFAYAVHELAGMVWYDLSQR